MSRKRHVFTLIHGGDLHLGPSQKVVKSKDFSTLLTADEMLKKVKADSDNYVQEVTEEAETIKEQARKEGFEEGFSAWADQIAYLENEIASVRGDVQKTIIPVALSAAKKVVGREIKQSKETVVDIVKNSLKAVGQHKKVTIYVSRSDYEILDGKREELKRVFEKVESLSLGEKADIEPGGCVIETEAGIINARLENQWAILEKAFQKITTPEPSKKEKSKKKEKEPLEEELEEEVHAEMDE